MKPFFGVGLVDALVDDADDDVVGDQRARFHHRFGLEADRRARRHRGAQHVAGRELRNAVFLHQPRRLGAFAGARRPEQDQPHLFLPLSLALRIRPSYWWACRWPWICATVSIVTLTTISSDVPPK